MNNITWHGTGGQIKVAGLGAVLATIDNWTLKSRGENRRDAPMWDLHGSLSYVNETLYKQLVDNGYRMAITLTAQGKTYNVEYEDPGVQLNGIQFAVKEITLNVR